MAKKLTTANYMRNLIKFSSIQLEIKISHPKGFAILRSR